jgi:hypothetical protein
MLSMQPIKRDLIFGFAVTVFVFICALAWGSPFIASASGLPQEQAQGPVPDQPQPAQPQQDQAQSFTGTVARDGASYFLHDPSGQVYKLDGASQAKLFVGKNVKITGELDEQAKLIHIQTIERTES